MSLVDVTEITKRLHLEEKDGKHRFYVDGKFVFEDKVRKSFTNVWHDLVSCGLDYEDAGKNLDGFLDYFDYRKDGCEEEGREAFEYCKSIYDAFQREGVSLWEVFNIVQE